MADTVRNVASRQGEPLMRYQLKKKLFSMDIYDIWAKALKNTEIIRPRVHGLMTNKDTPVPYMMLSESSINPGDTVIRKGEVLVEKPALLLPPAIPQFGFDFESKDHFHHDGFVNFLVVRGITLPSMKYNNTTNSLDIFEGDLAKAIDHHQEILQREENVTTGLITGPEECWQFSILIYICSQVVRNAPIDIRNFLKNFKDKA